jgi:hypothetical protein
MVKRRLRLLGLLSFAGSVLFVPFMAYTTPGGVSTVQAVVFVVATTAIALLASWRGLLLADAVKLPMPFLRAWEEGIRFPSVSRTGVVIALLGSALFAAAAIGLQGALGTPTPPSPIWARLLSAPFAAITLEVVLHLLGMSLLYRLLRGNAWGAIVGSGLLLGVFHLAGSDASWGVTLILAGVNTTAGIFLGWLYWAFGFEYLVVAHALVHAIAVSLT